ncbi:hypothetical protein T484DRAFT_1762182 [Baffinella frigidus]|nr:hypothetical protein T484DRAFT_1762182 [Cryptophyta sp. CCMP2293]
MVAALPAWDDDEEDEDDKMETEETESEGANAKRGDGEGLGREKYACGTYELPVLRNGLLSSAISFCELAPVPKKGLLSPAFLSKDTRISRRKIAQLLHDALFLIAQLLHDEMEREAERGRWRGRVWANIAQLLHDALFLVTTRTQVDSQLLKALTKAVDVVMNGVDILQKTARRLRLRYTIMKARNREIGADGFIKLLPRYMIVAKMHHYYLQRVMLRQRKAPSLSLAPS